MHNPTNCKTNPATGVIQGGGSDPANPAAFSTYPVSFEPGTTDCGSLAFAPKLSVKLLGGTQGHQAQGAPGDPGGPDTEGKRSQHRLHGADAAARRCCWTTRISKPSARGCSWRPSSARRRPSTATPRRPHRCSSGNLSGPVYLVSSNDKLPNLVADLRGQINVQLRGVVSLGEGRDEGPTFPSTPDAPVTKFVLKMNGGTKGLSRTRRTSASHREQGQAEHQGPERQGVQEQQAAAEDRRLPEEEEVTAAQQSYRAPARRQVAAAPVRFFLGDR